MKATEVLQKLGEFGYQMAQTYISDLKDEELVERAVPTANHIAWQLGHLIASDHEMLTLLGCTPPALPTGFAEAHTKETAGSNEVNQFAKKQQYLDLMEQMKQTLVSRLQTLDDAELDGPAPEQMQVYAKTMGDAYAIVGEHWLMHAGQWVPIRRKLGKPPLF